MEKREKRKFFLPLASMDAKLVNVCFRRDIVFIYSLKASPTNIINCKVQRTVILQWRDLPGIPAQNALPESKEMSNKPN